ncbi:ABC transporter substrate-binding protein [Roseococcus sp. DSY-14]|uniref:ABC transporter substrate-binding protein n=1 Tax=Roseococcus sp. DSY-14 TaxID=3369650 RepID=UPI00387AA254
MFRRSLFAALAVPAIPQAQERAVRVGGGLAAEAPQYAVALERGLFREAGVNPAVTNFPTGREAFEALVGGQLDVALMTEFPAVVGALRGQRFGVMAVLSRYTASRIMGRRRAGITETVASLAGKKVGVTVGTNTHFMLAGELAAAGITAEIVNAGPADLVPTLVRGDVDAIASFPSFYAGARRAVGADLAEIPVRGYQPTYLIAGSEAFLRNDAEAAQRVLRALVRGDAVVAADTAAAQAAVGRIAGRAQTADAIRENWGDYQVRTVLDAALVSLMQRQGAWLVERGAARGQESTVALMRAVVAEAPLHAVDAARVAL